MNTKIALLGLLGLVGCGGQLLTGQADPQPLQVEQADSTGFKATTFVGEERITIESRRVLLNPAAIVSRLPRPVDESASNPDPSAVEPAPLGSEVVESPDPDLAEVADPTAPQDPGLERVTRVRGEDGTIYAEWRTNLGTQEPNGAFGGVPFGGTEDADTNDAAVWRPISTSHTGTIIAAVSRAAKWLRDSEGYEAVKASVADVIRLAPALDAMAKTQILSTREGVQIERACHMAINIWSDTNCFLSAGGWRAKTAVSCGHTAAGYVQLIESDDSHFHGGIFRSSVHNGNRMNEAKVTTKNHGKCGKAKHWSSFHPVPVYDFGGCPDWNTCNK